MVPKGRAKAASTAVFGGLILAIGACGYEQPPSLESVLGSRRKAESAGTAGTADRPAGAGAAGTAAAGMSGAFPSTGGAGSSTGGIGPSAGGTATGGTASGGMATGGTATGGKRTGDCSIAYHYPGQSCITVNCHQPTCSVATQCQNCLDLGTKAWCPGC
jgi:hypothetical protein